LRAAKWKNSVSTASVVSSGSGTAPKISRQRECQRSSASTAASITPVSISPAGGIGFLFVLPPDDFAHQFAGPRGTCRISAAQRTHGRHHSPPDYGLLGFVVPVALFGEPVRRDAVQERRHGSAFPPGCALQFGLSLRRDTPTVDFSLHALQCSALALKRQALFPNLRRIPLRPLRDLGVLRGQSL